MNAIAAASSDDFAFRLLQSVKRCQALLSILRTELDAIEIDSREYQVMQVVHDLASDIYRQLWETSYDFSDFHEASGFAGKLKATVGAMVDVGDRVCALAAGAERRRLAESLGWLQCAASDLADEFLALMLGGSAVGHDPKTAAVGVTS